jgi:hypothetical protein
LLNLNKKKWFADLLKYNTENTAENSAVFRLEDSIYMYILL